MKQQLKTAAGLCIVLALAACSHMTPRYGMSAANIEAIHQAAGANPQKVSVGNFTSTPPGAHSITCRAAGAVATPDGEPFATYIQNAMTSELKVAGAYAAESPVRIDGKLDKVDFNSNIGNGKWIFDLTLTTPTGAPIELHEVHEFSTNWVADKACEQVAAALQPSVQELLAKFYASQGFKSMVSGGK